MKAVIRELKGIINHYKKQKEENIVFLKSDKFKESILEPKEENVRKTIEYAEKVYDGYIGEIEKAITILERCRDSRRKRYMRRFR